MSWTHFGKSFYGKAKEWSEPKRGDAERGLQMVILSPQRHIDERKQALQKWCDIQLARLAIKSPEAKREHTSAAGRVTQLVDAFICRAHEARNAYNSDPNRPELKQATHNLKSMIEQLHKQAQESADASQLLDALMGCIKTWQREHRIGNLELPAFPMPLEITAKILGFVEQTNDMEGAAQVMGRAGSVSRHFREAANLALCHSRATSHYMSMMRVQRQPTEQNLRRVLQYLPHVHLEMPEESFRALLAVLDQLTCFGPQDLCLLRSLSIRCVCPNDPVSAHALQSRLVAALTNLHGHGRDNLTTHVSMPALWPEQAAFFLGPLAQVAGMEGSKLTGVMFDHRFFWGMPALPNQNLAELVDAVTKPGNRLESIELGDTPVGAADLAKLLTAAGSQHSRLTRLVTTRNEGVSPRSVVELLTSPDNKMVRLGLRLSAVDLVSADSLTEALRDEHCKLEAAVLDFASSGNSGYERALGEGLQRALQDPRGRLRVLALLNLHDAGPVVRTLALSLQPLGDAPAPLLHLEALAIEGSDLPLDGLGTDVEAGTLAAAIAHPQSPLRRLSIVRCDMSGSQKMKLIRAAAAPDSRLEAIHLEKHLLGWRDMHEINNLGRAKPGLHISLD